MSGTIVVIAGATGDLGGRVSALSGLRNVIVDTQSVLLDAAVNAGVPVSVPIPESHHVRG